MGSMINLLHKSFKAFAIYASILLLASIPIYFLVVDWIWVNEIDEHHLHVKEKIAIQLSQSKLDAASLEESLAFLNALNTGIQLTPSARNAVIDSKFEYYKTPQESSIGEEERIRGLKSTFATPNGNFDLVVETSFEEANETFLFIAMVTFFFLIVFVLGLLILQNKLNKQLWQPFYDTLHKLKTFDLTQKKPLAFSPQNIIEFEDLNQSLQLLTQQNITAFQQQKTFIENASHELQTPIALLRSKIDLLRQTEAPSSDLVDAIAKIEPLLSRVSRINKNLLLLAKVDNEQFNSSEKLELLAFISHSLTLFEDYIEAKSISVKTHFAENTLLTTNEFLLETLLHNLISNAIKYSDPNSEIQLETSSNGFSIKNEGNEPLSSEEIFLRFKRSTAAETGSGLGLSIVQEICNKYHWQINYRFENKQHIFAINWT
jgi:signal transduction histidine kinase